MSQKNTMKKIYAGLFMTGGLLLMGFTMPSCPGQQAMQMQIDALTAKNNELSKTVQSHDALVKKLQSDVADINNKIGTLAQVLDTHKSHIEQAEKMLEDMKAARGKAKAGRKR